MKINNNLIKSYCYNRQRGVALLIILLIIGTGALFALLRTQNQNNLQLERNKKTVGALAIAKESLIGYAVSMNLQPNSPARPGDLPCPDNNNDGSAESTCGSAAGSNQSARIGRLPWKTLNLPDLRDGYGERLWYAVSNNFKINTRHSPLNINTNGTITVRDSAGNIVNNGSSTTGAVAVIIAPGLSLVRAGATSMQNRACTVVGDCSSAICTTAPTSLTPHCNPINYLDIASGEDNANFADGTLNGFIQGNSINTNDQFNNDQISIITKQELMVSINRRVKAEAANCPGSGTCHISTFDSGGWWLINGWQAFFPVP